MSAPRRVAAVVAAALLGLGALSLFGLRYSVRRAGLEAVARYVAVASREYPLFGSQDLDATHCLTKTATAMPKEPRALAGEWSALLLPQPAAWEGSELPRLSRWAEELRACAEARTMTLDPDSLEAANQGMRFRVLGRVTALEVWRQPATARAKCVGTMRVAAARSHFGMEGAESAGATVRAAMTTCLGALEALSPAERNAVAAELDEVRGRWASNAEVLELAEAQWSVGAFWPYLPPEACTVPLAPDLQLSAPMELDQARAARRMLAPIQALVKVADSPGPAREVASLAVDHAAVSLLDPARAPQLEATLERFDLTRDLLRVSAALLRGESPAWPPAITPVPDGLELKTGRQTALLRRAAFFPGFDGGAP